MGEVKCSAIVCSSTVFFEDPFWVAVFQRYENGKLSVAKVTLGAEPKNSELYELFLKKLLQPAVQPGCGCRCKRSKEESEENSARNPKGSGHPRCRHQISASFTTTARTKQTGAQGPQPRCEAG